MECLNVLVAYRAAQGVTPELDAAIRDFILLLAPFAPFIAEELWERLGGAYSVHSQPWPTWDPAVLAAEQGVTLVVQVDGRVEIGWRPRQISARKKRAPAPWPEKACSARWPAAR